VGVHNIT